MESQGNGKSEKMKNVVAEFKQGKTDFLPIDVVRFCCFVSSCRGNDETVK